MLTHPLLAATWLALALAPRFPAAQGDGPFRALTFEAACEAAKKENKVVMIDFFTTWCGPCKKLDAVTWKDEAVVKWLTERTVPMKIDAEQDEALAGRFKLDAYPSIVFVQPDGKELGRLVGFKEPQPFLSAANDLLAGIRASDRIKKQLEEKGWKDPMLRKSYAKELVRERRHEEALEQYLWCFDHGNDDPMNGFAGVRLSFLLAEIVQLGQKHPQALVELRARRDAAKTALLDGTATLDQASEFGSIDNYLGDARLTLEVYDKLASVEPKTIDGRRTDPRPGLFRHVKDLLIEERRYADFLAGTGDPEKYYASRLEHHRMSVGSGPDDPRLAEYVRQKHIDEASELYEALLGAQENEPAARIKTRILEFDASGKTLETLAKHALRAGRTDIADALAKEAEEGRDG